MNRFITLLVLGVVAAAMLLVLGLHVIQAPEEDPATPVVVITQPGPSDQTAQAGQTGQAGRSDQTGQAGQAGRSDQAGRASGATGDNTAVSSTIRTPVTPPAEDSGRAATGAASSSTPSATSASSTSSATSTSPGGAQPAVIPVQTRTEGSQATQSGRTTQPAQSGQTQSGQKPQATQASRSTTPATQPATASVSRGKGNIVSLGLHFKGRGMALVIEGDGPLPVRQFALNGPERLVVDLPGSWKGLKAPAVPGNNLVKAVRVGRQGDADRLVLDLKSKLKNHSINRISDNKVEILFD